MNPHQLIRLFCLWLGTTILCAAANTTFERANQRFDHGDFAGAAAAYQQLLTEYGPRAAVFYNLGNCYQRLGQYGPAILAYERARLLTPRDPDLLANLALARKAATAFEEPGSHPRLDTALNYLSRNEWSWLVAIAALLLGCIAVIRGTTPLSRPWLRPSLLATTVLACIALLAGTAALYLRRDESNRGIVLSAAATVRLSPFDNAEALGTPGAGRSVRLGTKSGSFLYVDVPGTNLQGWMPDKDVAAIMPGSEER